MDKFSLSLDDFSPSPKAGLNFESIEWCNKLIEKYPNFKITLFVPARYTRLNDQTYALSDNLEWCKKVSELPKKNYQIGTHGLYHSRSRKYFHFHSGAESNNDEFELINRIQADKIIGLMLEEFRQSKLPFVNIFRPPAWKISVGAAQVLTEFGFVIAGDKKYYKALRDKVPGLRWVCYDWDLVSECKTEGDVIAFGHTSNWTNNYFDEEKYNKVVRVLESRSFEFKFLTDTK